MDHEIKKNIISILREINHDEFREPVSVGNELEDILKEVTFLSNKMNSFQERTEQIIHYITEYCTGDLSLKLPISEEEDQLDVISMGFNTFIEELTATTVSKERLEEANREIVEREKKLDEAQRIAKIGSWDYNLNTNETIWSKEMYSIFEIQQHSSVDLVEEFRKKIHPEDLSIFEKMASHDPKSESNYIKEFRIICNNNIKHILATIYSNFDKNKKRQILGTFQDITERKIAEQKQLELEQLKTQHKKKIIKAILFTKEREQKRIAQELHDDIGSSLMVIKFAIHKFEVSEDKKAELYEAISDIVEKVRHLSNELSPSILEEFGLINALNHYTNTLKKSTHLNIEYLSEISALDELTKEEEISLYRVVQEVINNILKYANADSILIKTFKTPNEFILEITDDGNGFIPSSKDKSKSTLGLLNIESRIDYIHGKIEYKLNIPKGTKVTIKKKLEY